MIINVLWDFYPFVRYKSQFVKESQTIIFGNTILYATLINCELMKVIYPNLADRRKTLLMIINKAMPHWKALESELYTRKLMVGGEELTAKENLNDLMFKYILLHKEGLKD